VSPKENGRKKTTDGPPITSVLECLRLGLSVIPCDPATKRPLIETWKPYQSRFPTEEEVRDWWKHWPEAAPAVVTGELSGLVVVDIDSADAVELKEAEKWFGETSWRARTPSGGMHLGYAHPGGQVSNACRISGFDFDIDIRGDGGYVLAPPSPGYFWECEDPFATRPPFRGIPRQVAPALESIPSVTQNDRIPRGERNPTLTSLGGTMRKRGMTSDAISAALLADNQKRCSPPLPKKEVLQIARSVAEYEPVDLRPRLLTAEEFANDLAPEEIIKGLIYRASIHQLTAASKVGKSWMAYQLVLSVQAGEPFLGLDVTRANVLLVSLEMSAGMLRKRMEDIHRDIGLPMPDIPSIFNLIAPTMDQIPSLNLASESGRTYLKEAIAATGAELVVLDTLYKFLPGCDPNSNAEMGPVFAHLGDLAQSTGAAILMLDHVAKGEHLGPVSHSAVGAQIKGGAARVIIGLKRTDRGNGGHWMLDVESHFGSWDEPLHYTRPRLDDGSYGGGCVLCDAATAFQITVGGVERLFQGYGERDEEGRPVFTSKRKLTEALNKSGLTSGNDGAAKWINALIQYFCVFELSKNKLPDRPVITRTGPRQATIFTWRGLAVNEGVAER
jgi:hypothetical protein